MPVQEVHAVHVIHDGVAEEHVAVLLGLRQGHTSKVQRVALRPVAMHARVYYIWPIVLSRFVCLCVVVWFGLLVSWMLGWAS